MLSLHKSPLSRASGKDKKTDSASPSPELSAYSFIIYVEAILLLVLGLSFLSNYLERYPLLSGTEHSLYTAAEQDGEERTFIKWVDFTVTSEAMTQAFRLDVDTCQSDIHLNWIELLAYLGARYGGDFTRYKASDLTALAEKLQEGASMEELTESMEYYDYYLEAYDAVLGGLTGVYSEEIPAEEAPPQSWLSSPEPPAPAESPAIQESAPQDTVWVTKYGLKAFSPIAKGFPYTDYDDFGSARSYGYKRRHLGHDMMGQVGTPIIAVESGTVEALGWNQYGGWRIGIRSFDKKRYYYYAHLRKNYPYQSNLSVGSTVRAGDVIGYLGRTGYSATENTNNIQQPHLHFGLQLIFDESQKEGNNEIWVSCYELVKFLRQNQCLTEKTPGTKEWHRVYETRDF